MPLFSTTLFAVNNPARLIRACLDRPTYTLTVSITPPSDACGSFVYHRLYGREDAISPWKLLKEVPTLNINSLSTTLPNTKTWEVYLSTSFACNGTDTLVSNRLFVDNLAPSQFEPDSVSIEFSTQRMVAGWKKPSDPDILGYSLFKLLGGGNALIKDTFSTFYRFDTTIYDPRVTGNLFSIAAFDSCLNGGLLSNYHSPINLIVQKDPKFWCSKKTQLTWSKYVGWKSKEYHVWRCSVDGTGWVYLGAVPEDPINNPNTYSFVDNSYEINKQYYYVVRAIRESSSITSSSNRFFVDYASPSNTKPMSLITGVSVIGKDQIRLDGVWKKDGPTSFVLLEKEKSGVWGSIATFSSSGYFTHNDLSVKTQQESANYRLIRSNDCGVFDDTSYTHNSILLTENQQVVSWSGHEGWQNNHINTTYKYHLEIKSGFTWNSLYSGASRSFVLPNNLYGNQTFRVKIYSEDGRFPVNYELYSNEITTYLGFDGSSFDTTLIPTAFNPLGVNKTFKISNPAISLGESSLSVFNRWGELVFLGDALVGWDGCDQSGSYVPQGTYVYLIEANYRNKKTRHAGTLLLIQ